MKLTNETIEKYRKIVADAPKGATHWDFDFGYLTSEKHGYFSAEHSDLEYCHTQDLDNLREIISLWDENQRLIKHLQEIAKKDGDVNYSQSDYEYALQDCIDTAKEVLGDD